MGFFIITITRAIITVVQQNKKKKKFLLHRIVSVLELYGH